MGHINSDDHPEVGLLNTTHCEECTVTQFVLCDCFGAVCFHQQRGSSFVAPDTRVKSCSVSTANTKTVNLCRGLSSFCQVLAKYCEVTKSSRHTPAFQNVLFNCRKHTKQSRNIAKPEMFMFRNATANFKENLREVAFIRLKCLTGLWMNNKCELKQWRSRTRHLEYSTCMRLSSQICTSLPKLPRTLDGLTE